MDPIVSIITPAFNHASYIEACITSVLAQTFADWEMIIVDDGSTDGTIEAAQRAAHGDRRVRIVEQENVGVFRLFATYNRALKLARGELVAVLEGDDLWEPRKLETQIGAFRSRPRAVLCFSDIFLVGESGDAIRREGPDPSVPRAILENEPVGAILNQLYLENCIPAVSVVARKAAIDRIGGFQQPDGLPLVDIPTWLALATVGPFAYVPEPLATWRWHPFQITKSYHTEILQHVHELVQNHLQNLEEQFAACVHVTRREIDRQHRNTRHRAYAQSGRFKLIQGRYAEARSDFLRAVFFPHGAQISVRLMGLAGFVSGLFRMDLEWAARLFGRTRIS
jgi:glycosyltransferase involved in cell wall biosynthesis